VLCRWLLFLAAPPVFAGCVAFSPPPRESACAAASPDWEWPNAPSAAIPAAVVSSPYHALLDDPALRGGVELAGTQEFRFRAAGRYLIEIFVRNPEADRFPFRLEADGRVLDARPVIAPGPGRLRPKRGWRAVTLLAYVEGPAELQLRSDAPRYVLAAARWTPAVQFESREVPRYLAAARQAAARILTEAEFRTPTIRRAWLQQLSERLAFSADPAVRREALLGRTRAAFWKAAEDHEPDDVLQTHHLFEEGLRAMPEHPILRQMISAACRGQVSNVSRMPSGPYCQQVEPMPWAVDTPAAPPGAPAWAVTQRRLMRRMEAITRWWVERRQAPNGELGGGWGDDVEILRHWGPQALGFGSEAAARGVLRLAAGLWESGALLDGYDRHISDVEHSSEPTTDTLPLAVALAPDDPAWRARIAATAACSEHWLAKQPDGHLRFRSSWYNCREADLSPARSVDVFMNVRAMGPALWHAFLSRDPALIRRIAAWTDAWIAAMRDTRHGKPAGIFPSAIKSADGDYLIRSARWDRPDAEWDYYQWSGEAQETLTSLVLAAFRLTGDRRYLEAAAESFQPLRRCAAHRDLCAALRSAPGAFREWRTLTGDPSYDAAFAYPRAETDDAILAQMAAAAPEAEARFAVNWDMLTTEVLYTDRVSYGLPAAYARRLFGGETPRGDRAPAFAVTWPPVSAEFARAVLEARPDALRLRVYSFEADERDIPLRIWQLSPGEYTWRAGARQGRIRISGVGQTITLPAPPQRDAAITISRAD